MIWKIKLQENVREDKIYENDICDKIISWFFSQVQLLILSLTLSLTLTLTHSLSLSLSLSLCATQPT